MHRLNTTSEGEMLVDEAELPITRSQYCDALDALRAAPAHYLKEVGDQWRTPDLLFWGVNAMYGPLVLDLFCRRKQRKMPCVVLSRRQCPDAGLGGATDRTRRRGIWKSAV
ncbi:DNA adenine methylase [Klebsiella variicola]|uniref:DNA adenine methylase n=1 Tax=Klebsiella variicola TaxID=244366 RepID=A0A7H4MPB9_KLEVA|nr:DNA adenine methylase [Klebsiella variicola]